MSGILTIEEINKLPKTVEMLSNYSLLGSGINNGIPVLSNNPRIEEDADNTVRREITGLVRITDFLFANGQLMDLFDFFKYKK